VQLAQVNVAEAVAPLSSPQLRGFVRLLDPIDELARRSPGFVRRPRPAEVTVADVALFGDPGLHHAPRRQLRPAVATGCANVTITVARAIWRGASSGVASKR
jgi:uncharacterized protein DUF3291